MQRAICCATLRSNFEFHRRIMNRYANSRIGIITHSCDIVFSHAVNRACFTGPTRHCAATRRGTMQRGDSMLADRTRKIRATKTGRSNYKRVHIQYTRACTRARTHVAMIFDVKTRRKNPSQTDRCEICDRDRVKISAHRRPC